MGHGAEAIDQLAQPTDQIARRRREPLLQHVKAGQRLEVALARPPQPHVGALRGRRVTVVDHHEGAVRHTQPEAIEQARMCGLGILAPDDDHTRPVAYLTERGRGRTAQRDRRRARPRAGDCPGAHQRTEPVGQRHRGARILDGGAVEAVHERAAGGTQKLGGAAQRGIDVDSLTVDRGRRSIVRAHAVREPLGAEATVGSQTHGVARGLDHHVVAQQTTPGAGDRAKLSHGRARRL